MLLKRWRNSAQVMPPAPGATHYISFCSQIDERSTQALLGACGYLHEHNASDVWLLLSTPGGTVMHGLTLFNLLRSMPFRLTTVNVGQVDSIGNVVFMAGEQRYACAGATFLFHGVSFGVPPGLVFDEMFTKERLDSIKADHARIAAIISRGSRLTVEQIERYFLEARTKDSDEALEDGLIQGICDLRIPPGAPFLQITAPWE